MKPLSLLIALVTVGGAIGAISWMAQPRPYEDIVDEAGRASENPFTIPSTGLHPKAVLEGDEEYNFGMMTLGGTQSHPFVIRNEGEAPLKLHKGKIACKCTVPTIPEGEIPPGGSAEVVMEWKPLGVTAAFDKWAVIWTNDPEQERIVLQITGEVRRLVRLAPPSPWTVGAIPEGETTTINGIIVSGLDAFKVLECVSDADWLKAETRPLSKTELESEGKSSNSGYEVIVTIQPEMKVGKFEEVIRVVTDLKEGTEEEIRITGTRQGSFSLLGRQWSGGDMTVRMGTVSGAEGNTVDLSLFIGREDEPIVIESVEATPDVVKVTMKRDDNFPAASKKEKYVLSFSIPPGTPVGRYLGEGSIPVTIRTNRAAIDEVNLSVEVVIE